MIYQVKYFMGCMPSHAVSKNICDYIMHYCGSPRVLAFVTNSYLANHRDSQRPFFNMRAPKANLCLFLLLPACTHASVDVRLIDATGNLASVGLVQIKTDAGFGSVCGANPAAADVICRSLGYTHGIVSSSPCAFYGAANMCGAPGSPVVTSHIPSP